jgi:hypothetical protein
MYPVDERDTVVELSDCPRPDIGAPLPVVLADDYNLVLTYLVSEPDPNWDGSYVTVVSPESEARLVAIVRFRRPYVHMFGPPNDEVFHGHPLAHRGLAAYSVSEVRDSSWLRQLERMNAVHERHDRARFMAARRHLVWAFHDSTLECIAEGFDVELQRGSIRSAMMRMIQLLGHEAV